MSSGTVAAVDLGATSGRVMLGHVGPGELKLEAVRRFPNGPVRGGVSLRWDATGLYEAILLGLTAALRDSPELASIGVDSWATDYALLRDGAALSEPFHYRDDRNHAAAQKVHSLVSPAELYARNGLQYLPFNTLYQLSAEHDLSAADSFLLIPDLITYWLTGRSFAERTNASTTGLLGVISREWDDELLARLGLPRSIFPDLMDAGTVVGTLTASVAATIGAPATLGVTAVGSHDTASAVVAVPATSDDFAYISCGTWGLVGVELEHPVLTEASRLANFTNEGGVDGRVRYLHNVMGLWLLTESVREWQLADATIELPGLLAAAAALDTPVGNFDANDPIFLAPGAMPDRIAQWCRDHGVAVPRSPVEFVRSIIESMAEAFAAAVRTASELSGKSVSVIHIVGGGSQNTLLCQFVADRSGLPVLAGPIEATALGNVLVQARTHGFIAGGLESLRALVATTFQPLTYLPRLR